MGMVSGHVNLRIERIGKYPAGFIRNSSTLKVNRIDKPLLTIHGERDNDPVSIRSAVLHRAMFDAGMQSKLIVYPDEKHQVQFQETQLSMLREVSAWLDEHMGPGE